MTSTLTVWQVARESNSQQGFWRPACYHYTSDPSLHLADRGGIGPPTRSFGGSRSTTELTIHGGRRRNRNVSCSRNSHCFQDRSRSYRVRLPVHVVGFEPTQPKATGLQPACLLQERHVHSYFFTFFDPNVEV